MWLKILTNKWVLLALVIIGSGLTIYFVGKSTGKKKGQGTQAKLPNSGSGIPKGWDPAPIARATYDSLKGLLTSPVRKQQTYSMLYALTNDQLTAVYNEFNRLYQGGLKGDTLYTWIKDEWVNYDPFTTIFSNDDRPLLLAKMVNLKLT